MDIGATCGPNAQSTCRETGGAVQHLRLPEQSPRGRPQMPPLVHKESSTSYLSSERITQLQHSGVINLGMVIVLATNSRLILENIIKYGLRANPLRWLQRAIGSSSSSNRLTLVGFLALGLCILLAYINEVFAVKLLRYVQLDSAVRISCQTAPAVRLCCCCTAHCVSMTWLSIASACSLICGAR